MKSTITKHALTFGLFSVFMTGLGFTIISPAIPFIVDGMVGKNQQAFVISLITAVYALFAFIAVPALGTLSDHFGRKPILLISILGSAVGYIIFGVGGVVSSLPILFLGRIIDGVTAGNVGALFAYIADITEPEERTKVFGWSAAAVGIGTILGPTVGGLLANFGNSFPFLVGAGLAILNFIFGVVAMPESLKKEKRSTRISFARLNPFTEISGIFKMKAVSRFMFTGLLIWLASGSLQATVSQFSIDSFAWSAVSIGLVLSIMGFQDIFTQTLVMPYLLKKLNEGQLMKIALYSEMIGFTMMSISGLTQLWPIFILSMFIYAFGDSVFGTAFNGLVSLAVSDNEQGRIQGVSQALMSISKFVGPIIGGQVYVIFGHAAPAIMGIILTLFSLIRFTHKS
jgi:DHA1 family tetracycline resistance protein-like MFS transporter